MKLSSICLIASCALVTPVAGFTDTAAFFSTKALAGEFPYITESQQLSESIRSLTEEACRGRGRLVIYRVSQLQHGPQDGAGTYIKHVHYKRAQELDFELGPSCSGERVQYVVNGEPPSQDQGVAIVDVEDGRTHTVEEFLGRVDGPVMVQGKPSFHRPESVLDGLKHYIEDAVYDNLNMDFDLDRVLHKRAEQPAVDDDRFDEIMAEVEQDFAAAKSLVAQAAGDAQVTALQAAPSKSLVPSHPVKNPNLFTNYGFFTPGIWMCLIISGFLVSIMYVVMSWMTSLEISYKAFDKQIDFEKKTE